MPLLVQEAATDLVIALVAKDPSMLVWWGSRVECVSALARLEREGALDRERTDLAFGRLYALAEAWHEIEPSEIVRENAIRARSPASGGDALQLRAAFVAAERRPPSLEMVAFDDRLADVARKEGFCVDRLDGDLTALAIAAPS